MRTGITYFDETLLYYEKLMLPFNGRCVVRSLCRLTIMQRGKLLPLPKACEKMGIIPPALERPHGLKMDWVKE